MMLRLPSRPQPARRQRGAATLVVVMVLFFIISLVAAYTSRNLVFEQRASANQYRATLALETAEAGLEWTIGMLNQGRITDACAVSTSVTDPSFRERYLSINTSTGVMVPVSTTGTALCVWNGTGWSCSCEPTAPTVTAPSGAGVFPAFRVRFRQLQYWISPNPTPALPSTVYVQVVGCTRLDPSTGDQCLNFGSSGAHGAANEGRALVQAMVRLTGNSVAPPLATLTARGDVDFNDRDIELYNTRTTGAAVNIQIGGSVSGDGNLVLRGPPGSRAALTVVENEAALNALTTLGAWSAEERLFASVFNMRSSSFREQPGAITVDCGSAGCDGAAIRDLAALNPGRPIWLNGNLFVGSSVNIGSAALPVHLVVNGNLQFTATGAIVNGVVPSTGASINGIVYLRKPSGSSGWSMAGNGLIRGAVVSDGDVELTSNPGPTLAYEPDIISNLRYATGSFVRVPGSWRDFLWSPV
jgi:Tfp pilus assembly protein PilX